MVNQRQERTFLVTGATGFIGRHVVAQLLQQNLHVIAISRTAQGLIANKNLDHVALDLHDEKAVTDFFENHQPSHLIHLAWEATPGLFWHSSENFKWLSSSITLLDQFITSGGKTATLAGTCAEYKWANEILYEDTSPLNPTTKYSASKHAFHTVAKVVGKDINLIWGRIFLPYGPDEDKNKLISHIAQEIRAGREPSFQTPGRAVDFIHVEDVAAALIALSQTNTSDSFNICSGQAVTPIEIAQTIIPILGKESLAKTFNQQRNTTKITSRVQGSSKKLDEIYPPNQRRTLEDGLKSYSLE